MTPEFGYSFTSVFSMGWSVGYNFSNSIYKSEMLNSDGTEIDGSELSSKSVSQTISFSPFLKWNIGLIDNFSLYVKFSPGFSMGNTCSDYQYFSDPEQITKQKMINYNVFLYPGFEYRLKKRFAFLLNLGSCGYGHSKTIPISGLKNEQVNNNFSSSFDLNNFSLGMIIYLSRPETSKL
jgi:hypothetical protein